MHATLCRNRHRLSFSQELLVEPSCGFLYFKIASCFFHNTIDRNFVTSCSLFATNAVSEPIADTELVFPTQRNTNRLFVGSKRLFVSFVAPLSNSFSVPLQDPFRLFRKFIRGKRKHEFCFARAIACNRGWRRFGLGLGRKRRIWLGAHRRRFG